MVADASPVELGAVFIQYDSNGPCFIVYGNKSLTDCEKRYCQTEKEALALVWSVEHFKMYLYGKDSFELVSDHKPLKVIFGLNFKPCARIERWVLQLQSYNYKVVYRPGKSNIGDSLSQLGINSKPYPFDDENYINLVTEQACPTAISLKDIKKAREMDDELKMVKGGLYNSNWVQSVKNYKLFEEKLGFQNILLRRNKILIPSV